jgi:serine/threonine protein kinase
VLLTSEFKVKITDFGSSRFVGGAGSMTMTASIGTPAYCAPELLLDSAVPLRGAEAARQMDVYSYGAGCGAPSVFYSYAACCRAVSVQ